MLELGPKELSFMKDFKEELPCKLQYVLALVKKHDLEFIGKGEESVIVASKENTQNEKIVAFNYENVSPEQAEKIFYLQRFFSTLFPHNFPHFYASSEEGTVRHRIVEKQYNPAMKALYSVTGFRPVKYSFSSAEKICKKLGIKVDRDSLYRNIIIGVDGGEYYVDTLRDANVLDLDLEKIINYMRKNKYSDGDIEMVSLTIERLKELNQLNNK